MPRPSNLSLACAAPSKTTFAGLQAESGKAIASVVMEGADGLRGTNRKLEQLCGETCARRP